VPAAGVGARMGRGRPKQYLRLGAQTMLEHSVRCLLADARVERVLVVLAPEDDFAQSLDLPPRCELLRRGGATRAHTVRNGIEHLRATAGDGDWVLVHDAARPCLTAPELAALIDGANDDENGAILAAPVSDTLKRERDGRIERTIERDSMWRALTPQFFRIDVLARAFEHGDAALAATDEAGAVELLGMHPRLIAGATSNLKITTESDLGLAEAILRLQGAW
jgi:2-C-methyl-D-erythritol 4-phosphate cytidylyltransferase